jgi:hypothetical protein
MSSVVLISGICWSGQSTAIRIAFGWQRPEEQADLVMRAATEAFEAVDPSGCDRMWRFPLVWSHGEARINLNVLDSGPPRTAP